MDIVNAGGKHVVAVRPVRIPRDQARHTSVRTIAMMNPTAGVVAKGLCIRHGRRRFSLEIAVDKFGLKRGEGCDVLLHAGLLQGNHIVVGPLDRDGPRGGP